MSWDHILQSINLWTNLTTDNGVTNWANEPSTTVWVLTALAGLWWILIRLVMISLSSRSLFTPRPVDGPNRDWWSRLRRYLPSWPRRPNIVLLVLSPSSSRSHLDEAANPDEDRTSANSPPSTEVVSFHFESNTSHRTRRRRAFVVPSAEGVSSNPDSFLSSVRFVPAAPSSD